MTSGESPAVARRRVRLAVRAARETMGLTQSDVAEKMEWSLSKVMRIESGEVTISQNDLRPLLAYLGVRERADVEDLVQAAKTSKQRRQWWDDTRYREALTPAMRQQIEYEIEATEVRNFCQSLMPGRLQTDAYAQALLSSYESHLSPDEIALRVESRARRRDQLLSQTRRPQIHLLFDEAVLLRQIGGKRTIGEQLSALGRYIDAGWLSARITPFTNPAPTLAPFELLYLGADSPTNAVLYRESDLADEIVDDVATIERHRAIWDRFWKTSIAEEESARLLKTRAAEFLEGDD
jgi:transcriptional regulator with XRE-family HTH domain